MSPFRILVVEDGEMLRKNIIEVLIAEGYDVTSAKSITLGVKAAQENPPDIIICNIVMPDIDDFSVLDSLRKNDLKSRVPFIFMVTKNELFRICSMMWESDVFIRMPFTANELYAAVHASIDKQQRNKGYN